MKIRISVVLNNVRTLNCSITHQTHVPSDSKTLVSAGNCNFFEILVIKKVRLEWGKMSQRALAMAIYKGGQVVPLFAFTWKRRKREETKPFVSSLEIILVQYNFMHTFLGDVSQESHACYHDLTS